MISRYSPAEITAIFSEESKLARWLEVELLACEGWAKLGRIPADALIALSKARIDAKRIAELEAEQGHDVAAFVSGVQETLGDEGRYLHYGLTSSDVVDTALATMLRDAAAVIDADAAALENLLAEQAQKYRTTVIQGRTHGVHAEPITLGIKFANHYDEVRRSRRRLAAAAKDVAVGQISGAVGTHATVPPAVEEHVCSGLNLAVAEISTQVVARDRHAAFVCEMATFGAVLERLATNVRLLQQTEIDELAEPFSVKQKGSSAMPHKRNPILCERVCGMARLLRGYAIPAMENVVLWHERDISQSSAERVIFPDACATLSFLLRQCVRIVKGLHVNVDTMRENIDRDGGIVYSQRVLGALIIDGGWPREKAYRAVQELARKARDDRQSFKQLVMNEKEVVDSLGRTTLEGCFDINHYLEHIDETFTRLGLAQEAVACAVPVAATQQ